MKNIQNAKSLPHGDPPKVYMASEQPSRITEAKDVKIRNITSFLSISVLYLNDPK